MKTKKSRAQLIEEALSAFPDASSKTIATKTRTSVSYVHSVRKQLGATPKAIEERIIGTMERKVPGGPATVVRATKVAATNVDDILDERASTYGRFIDVAFFSQRIKELIRNSLDEQNVGLQVDHIEALDMISSKIARIVVGDPNYVDNWVDIAGYAQLVADRLEGKTR
jgi:hypothetical protein